MNQIGWIEVIAFSLLVSISSALIFFSIPRIFFPVLLISFSLFQGLSQDFSFFESSVAYVFMSALFLFGGLLTFERGKDAFYFIVKRTSQVHSISSAGVITFILSILSLSLILISSVVCKWLFFFFLFSVLLIGLPRTCISLILNLIVCINAVYLSQLLQKELFFFIIWLSTVLLTFFGLGLDLPEAREFLWVFKPRKKKVYCG